MDWSNFTKSITIKNTSADKIYASFASSNGMQNWFLRKCNYVNVAGRELDEFEFAEANDTYTWYWYGYNDEVKEAGTIIAANNKDQFEFTFNASGKNDMKVKVMILQELDEFRVDLHQYNIPEDDNSKMNYFIGCGEGWTFYLANLKSILEGGIDLRNKDENIKKVINS